jgi:hypothetical protein
MVMSLTRTSAARQSARYGVGFWVLDRTGTQIMAVEVEKVEGE